MFFYKIDARLANYDSSMTGRSFAGELASRQEACLETMQKGFVTITEIKRERVVFCAILGSDVKYDNDVETCFNDYLEQIALECDERSIKEVRFEDIAFEEITFEEITFEEVNQLLPLARRNGFISDVEDVFSNYNMEKLYLSYHRNAHLGMDFAEEVVPEIATLDEEYLADDRTVALQPIVQESLKEELERINSSGALNRKSGHPVHYIVGMNDALCFNMANKVLISALEGATRLRSKRYTTIYLDKACGNGGVKTIDELYKISYGGTIVISLINSIGGDMSTSLKDACDIAVRYKDTVLTVFNLPDGDLTEYNRLKQTVYDKMSGGFSFVEITEPKITKELAVEYYGTRARLNEVETDEELLKTISDGEAYGVAELNTSYDNWFAKKLKVDIYPQYGNIPDCKTATNGELGKSAYAELTEMVGLDEVKAVINRYIKFFKAQRLLEKRGVKKTSTAMHMVFTGNPGTAKTTVARLLAKIMKENGVLSVGNLYELGRADLVGRYVGWTAQLVRSRFKEAKGSVLFIDEAYSLVDGSNSFGDEAINTIVQELENNRDDMIVIFAGYPREMERLLNKNPGLRSRLAYHINFDDYTAQQLYLITELIASKDGMKLDCNVKEKLLPVFEEQIKHGDFGNGRFARNLFEKAKMKQLTRLLDFESVDNLTDEELVTLTADDFDISEYGLKKTEQKRVIGFV